MHILNVKIRRANISIESIPSVSNDITSTIFSSIITSGNKIHTTHYRLLFEDKRYILFKNKRLTHRNKKIENILYSLEWQIVDDLIKKNKYLLQFHAAVMSYKSKGWIFVGNSGSGKTSISIYLLKHGWGFLSDEFALVNPSTSELTSFPRNLIIKPHLSNCLNIPKGYKSIMINKNEGGKYPVYFLSPSLFGPVVTDTPIPLKKIIFLKKSEKGKYHIEKIGQSETFKMLTDHLFNPHNFKQKLPDILISIIRKTSSYKLTISNPLMFSKTLDDNFVNQIEKL